ncbi:MAG: rhodanese-like domain-containing protein [Candidatus Moraniibacteriota bacterium]|jgi:rhodanese-related sulfurtransferase
MSKQIIIVSIFCVVLLTGCSSKDDEESKLVEMNMIEECQAESCEQLISDSLSASEFKEKLDSGEYDLIDIRTRDEYMNERIADVPNIDIYEDDFDERLEYLDKEKKYLIYCEHGNRTKMGLQRMRTLGFPEVYDLDEGIVEWKKNNFDVIGSK